MLIQQLIRTDAERILINFQNGDGAGSITTGMGIALAEAGASIDGITATAVAAGNVAGFSGVAVSDVAINAFGLATVWGFAASVAISQSVGSFTITGGDILRISGDAGHFTSVLITEDLSTQLWRYVIAAGAVDDTISNPRVFMSGIVKAL